MKFLLGIFVGLLLALVLSGSPATAQTIGRMYGTISGGAAQPVAVNSSGVVIVKLQ